MTATLTAPAGTATESSQASVIDVRELVPYAAVGVLLGVVMVKSEVIFWQRIQEMFRFESFHMYGVLGAAFATAFASLQLLKRFGARAASGDMVRLAPKEMKKGHRYWIGGAMFGAGWALCGACPGPLFALIGSGRTVYVITAVAALLGTWTYGVLRPRLPH